MSLYLFVFAFLLSISSFFHFADCLRDDVGKENGLYVLDDENFEAALHDFNVLFVNFYDPSNNRSKFFTHPEMRYASQDMENDDIPVAFARMDCKVNSEIQSFYNFTRLPTLRLFRFGRIVPEEYQHARNAIEIVPWIRHKTNQITRILKTKDDLVQFQQQVDANGVVIGLFHDFNNHLTRNFCLTAMTERTLFFAMALTSNKDIFYEIVNKNESSNEKIFVFKTKIDHNDKKTKLEKIEMQITQDTNELDVYEFIKFTAHPLITTFQEEKAMKLFGSTLQLHALLFTNIELNSHYESMLVFQEVASVWRYRCNFMNVLSNSTRLMKSFEVYINELPVFFLLDMESGSTYKKHRYQGEMKKEGMIKFISDYEKGKLGDGSRLWQPKTADEIGTEHGYKDTRPRTRQKIVFNDDHTEAKFVYDAIPPNESEESYQATHPPFNLEINDNGDQAKKFSIDSDFVYRQNNIDNKEPDDTIELVKAVNPDEL